MSLRKSTSSWVGNHFIRRYRYRPGAYVYKRAAHMPALPALPWLCVSSVRLCVINCVSLTGLSLITSPVEPPVTPAIGSCARSFLTRRVGQLHQKKQGSAGVYRRGWRCVCPSREFAKELRPKKHGKKAPPGWPRRAAGGGRRTGNGRWPMVAACSGRIPK
jgi:hypothetical protein